MHREDLQGDLLFSIPGFFSAEECRRAIAFSEGLGYADAPLTTALGFVMNKEVRNNTRVMVDVPRVAAEVFERAYPSAPFVRLRTTFSDPAIHALGIASKR